MGRERKKIYKALFCGDRNWSDRVSIRKEIHRLIKENGVTNLVIIEGGAPGADYFSRIVAESNNVHVAEVKALWNTRHKGAGPQRNKVMRALEPDEVICFHDNIDKSVGTKSMKELAEEWGIPTKVVKSRGKNVSK